MPDIKDYKTVKRISQEFGRSTQRVFQVIDSLLILDVDYLRIDNRIFITPKGCKKIATYFNKQ